MRKVLIAGVVATALLATSGLVWAQKSESAIQKPAINLALVTWVGYGPYFVAKEKGFFGDLQVDAKVLDDVTARYAAYQSGDMNMMVTVFDTAAVEATQGIDGQLFLALDESLGADGVVAKKDISSIANLKGKKVAFARGVASHYFLHNVLQKNGLSLRDIQQVITDDPSIAANMLIAGQVDAAATYEPFLTQAAQDNKILATTKELPGTLADVIWARPEIVIQPEVLKQFAQGWLKAVDYVAKYPKESHAIMAKGFGLKPQEMADMLKGARLFNAADNAAFMCGNKAKGVGIYNEAAKMWLAEKVIDRASPKAHKIFNQTLCGDVYK